MSCVFLYVNYFVVFLQEKNELVKNSAVVHESMYLQFVAMMIYLYFYFFLKVRGLCTDLSNNEELFESVRVYGDLQDSDIYGLWYGHYSYGHLGGVWTNNLMHGNRNKSGSNRGGGGGSG